jgi:hypothetical protein
MTQIEITVINIYFVLVFKDFGTILDRIKILKIRTPLALISNLEYLIYIIFYVTNDNNFIIQN